MKKWKGENEKVKMKRMKINCNCLPWIFSGLSNGFPPSQMTAKAVVMFIWFVWYANSNPSQ